MQSLWQGSKVAIRSSADCQEKVLTVPDSEEGVLTGAYNFSEVAYEWGKLPPEKRLDKARSGAKLFGKAFGEGLEHGVTIAWQNMPYIKGGWAQWHAVVHFNALAQGSSIHTGDKQTHPNPKFFVIGEQLSSLQGWQEGAIAAALNAISRVERRLMVEGV
ncbi:hypothetical protein [Pseudoalteromonas byunsanensis]|uniref:Amine oxidase domain-containing protein n=1 Tax=Pseudoalteromonas byunsanensis TaxID=327939 RepID=A0A1S1N540_9GAMM|nr:hypothetical protein [Pseudoalteromonas byunsanensis]OHU96237.1 hypothetical protein BIW53_06740 [Pseudoalteromonas byunsanensis]